MASITVQNIASMFGMVSSHWTSKSENSWVRFFLRPLKLAGPQKKMVPLRKRICQAICVRASCFRPSIQEYLHDSCLLEHGFTPEV